jgi:hypothetical protein
MGNLKRRQTSPVRHFHVLLHRDRWWVEDEEGATVHASADPQEAVTWAIRAAQAEHARGLEVLVCVEQPDGSWMTAWHS